MQALQHRLAPSELTVPVDRLDKEFFELAAAEGVTDIEELNKVLDRAVGLRAFLKADDRVAKVAAFVAEHFKENVLPLGYKAFVVAVDREACAKYKQALDKLLPPEWTEAVYTENAADVVDRPLVAQLQLSDEREEDVRLLFKKADKDPKILIVTDKLLTGYDAPLLYCLYLDKPMRDHVLLQAVARVNRPYVDKEGIQKKIGLVIDFVGVLRELKKALQFDSSDVDGVIEDLDLLMKDFLEKIAKASVDYLDAGEGGDADERLERLVYGRFLEPEPRKAFFEAYKDIENLWEILSPSKELVDHIGTFKRLAQLYAAVRNAYADKIGFVADLAYKTRQLVEQNATQDGLGRLTKSVTFDVKTLEALRSDNPDEQRQLRASLYRPLISLPKDARAGVVDLIMANVFLDRIFVEITGFVLGAENLERARALFGVGDRRAGEADDRGVRHRRQAPPQFELVVFVVPHPRLDRFVNRFTDDFATAGDSGHRQRNAERGLARTGRRHKHGQSAADRERADQPAAARDHGGACAILPLDLDRRRRRRIVDRNNRVRQVPLAPSAADHRVELKAGLLGRVTPPVRCAADGQGGREGKDLGIG